MTLQKEPSKSDKGVASECGFDENEFDNVSVTDDDYVHDANFETTTSEQTEITREDVLIARFIRMVFDSYISRL